jgi:hypothetical protein
LQLRSVDLLFSFPIEIMNLVLPLQDHLVVEVLVH